jgi:hypothetical protein
MEQDYDYVCIITGKIDRFYYYGEVIMNGEWVKVWKEPVIVYFNIYVLETEGNHENLSQNA